MNAEQPAESPAVAALKADAAAAAGRAAQLQAVVEASARAAPVETALALLLAALSRPGLAADAVALGDGAHALTPASVAALIGAPVAAVQIWAAAIAASATGAPAAAVFDIGGGECVTMTFHPPLAGGPIQ